MNRTLFLSTAMALVANAAFAAEDHPAMRAFLQDMIMPWAHDTAIVEAIKTQNGVTGGYDAAQIEQLDLAWRAEVGTGATPTIDPVLHSPVAEFLRQQVASSNGVITEVFVMDAHGLNVAASGVTSDYWQGDEAKFQETYPQGAEAVHFSEIEFDESSQSYQAQISLSLTDPATGEVIGAMTVGIVADALM